MLIRPRKLGCGHVLFFALTRVLILAFPIRGPTRMQPQLPHIQLLATVWLQLLLLSFLSFELDLFVHYELDLIYSRWIRNKNVLLLRGKDLKLSKG